jgi:hypothetical protein
MTRVCTVCTHPQREAIDRALIAGEPYRDIARRQNISKDAIARHKSDHLPPAMVKAAEVEDVAHALDVVQQLKAINVAALHVLKEARTAGDGALALKAIDRIQRQIELQAKLLGDLDERSTVNILVSPEWVAVQAVLFDALRSFPEARIVASEALAAVGEGQ